MRLIGLALVASFAVGPALAGSRDPAPVHVAASTLGDLTPFRVITADTLAIVQTGDITAARARIKDLETSWDRAESTLKPKDKASWTRLDGKIDNALTDLRMPNPKTTACEASLKDLLAAFDAAKST